MEGRNHTIQNRITHDAVDPIKIYEYMALDLPTVSFRIPQIDKYPYTITVENNEEFSFALDEYYVTDQNEEF